MWVCKNCGSNLVERKMWIKLNTSEFIGDVSDEESDDNWCPDCETHCELKYIKDE